MLFYSFHFFFKLEYKLINTFFFRLLPRQSYIKVMKKICNVDATMESFNDTSNVDEGVNACKKL